MGDGRFVVPGAVGCLGAKVQGRLRGEQGGGAPRLELGDGLVAAAEAVESVGPRKGDVVAVVVVFSALRRQGIQHGQGVGKALRVVEEEGLGAEGVAVVGGELEDWKVFCCCCRGRRGKK